MATRAKLAGALALAGFLIAAAVAFAAVNTKGILKVTVVGQVKPYRLPRNGTAPISVFLSGHVSEKDQQVPPQVSQMTIKLNKHGKLEAKGIPSCTIDKLQPATTERALSNCGPAVVGSGRFWANVVLPGQDPYATRGRLLIFNGKDNGRNVLFAHIYTEKPFPTSFVITFSIRRIDEGPFGTELVASLPSALGSWGFVDRIKLTLKHISTQHGKTRSYFNAGCPAPAGVRIARFPLAKVRFQFAGGQELTTTLAKSCAVKE
jgi:hypothetical protein